jgi:hypothetical protein
MKMKDSAHHIIRDQLHLRPRCAMLAEAGTSTQDILVTPRMEFKFATKDPDEAVTCDNGTLAMEERNEIEVTDVHAPQLGRTLRNASLQPLIGVHSQRSRQMRLDDDPLRVRHSSHGMC